MEKRLLLAIALSMLVLITYSSITARFFPKPPHSQGIKDVTISTTNSYGPKELPPVPEKLPLPKSVSSKSPKQDWLSLQNPDLSLFIDPRGSAIIEAKIGNYNFSLPQSDMGQLAEWKSVKFASEDITNGKILSYDYKDKGYEIRKIYRFTEDRYILEMDLEFISHSTAKSYVKYNLNIASLDPETFKIKRTDPAEQRYLELSISFSDKILRKQYFSFTTPQDVAQLKWVGVRDRYFCSAIRPLQEAERIVKSIDSGVTSYLLESKTLELLPGQKLTHSYKIYLGPQKQEFLEKLGAGSEEIVNFGFFDTLSQILLGTLRLLYRVSKSWGLTLVLFSILIFFIMFPLSIKSFSSMKRMQELQPEIEQLKAQYKDNAQKLHKEIMELYRREKINPLGGCLPLVLQMPIFVSLFQLLMRFVDLKGARFLWIKDLSEPDRLFIFPNLPTNIPIVGNELNLLPIIMIITMLLQQKLTGAKQVTAGDAAKQQKMMSLFMSVFFGIIFYRMPSGLVLYWSINSLLTLVFQMRLFKQKVKV